MAAGRLVPMPLALVLVLVLVLVLASEGNFAVLVLLTGPFFPFPLPAAFGFFRDGPQKLKSV